MDWGWGGGWEGQLLFKGNCLFKGSGGHWLEGGQAFTWLIFSGCLFEEATYSGRGVVC